MDIKITGFKEIDKALANLEKKDARKIIRRGLREGLKITLKKVRLLAPVGISRTVRGKAHSAGQLRKSLKLRAAKSKKKGQIRIRVSTGAKDYQGESFYASMVNWGTVRQKGQLYMNRALDETGSQVIARTNEKVRAGINQTLNWWRRI